MITKYQFKARLVCLAVLTLGVLAFAAQSSWAESSTITLEPGPLGFVKAPAIPAFGSKTLSGQNIVFKGSDTIDVSDATGSGAGWNVTATSTTWTSGTHTLPTSATAIGSAPSTPTCDESSTCEPATPTAAVSYPYTLPASTTAPTATEMYSAAANTGMGNETLTPSWTLTVPSKAFAGAYTSTWTMSVVSGP